MAGTDRGGIPDTDDAPDVAGAPLDLLLADATRGGWRALAPRTSALRFAGGLARRPGRLVRRGRGLAAELGRIAFGTSTVAPEPRDRRFTDDAWSGNPFLRRTLQAYLAASHTADALVGDAELTETDALRVSTVVSNTADALAPSNNPLLNPRALKAVVDSGGANLVRGVRNLARDVAAPPRIPRMVEPDAFAVGETVGTSPGTVVARTPVFELISYAPVTEQVHETPLLIVPPTINKFYVVDLAPGRSLVEYLVGRGHQVFVMSWRNPDVRHADWGFDTYGEAILTALRTCREVTGAPRTSVLSMCSGGILTSMVLAHLAARGELDTIAAAALSVAVLDQADTGQAGALLTPAVAEAAVRASAARGYLDGRSLAEVFAWLRPNDLVWNYWVDSYLLGRSPKPFDVLFWNADTTRMTAALHRDFIDLARRNALVDGSVTMLGTPVDLSAVTVDTYVTAGATDHLCPWQRCYATTRLFGGKSRFVLSSGGHIASIVNPPPGARSRYQVSDHTPADPDGWAAGAEQVDGSWWPDFDAWLTAHAGPEVSAPTTPSTTDHPALCDAPGTYVHVS
ncbi:PHA/PHB synthase family protein [Pseudonocardia endophytica]|uniref:Polyhydroxyalkanoate synthase n=1 Tax=Pseudonocardia endophytica TaxID=401976 RepID=A0A4R1HXT3_PSEEN|nr:alpha/beta fold hydrolase [Pseudonocardia endophytica]TCK27587.1 polyhydroxyalkanoate synthase [Pseudonocardia endophytica]